MLFSIFNKSTQQQITMLTSLTAIAEQFPDNKQVIETDADGELLTSPVMVDVEIAPVDDEAKKVYGEVYADSGVRVPLTSVDAVGLMQIKTAFELGVTATTMVFSNDQKLPLNPETFPAFAAWFTQKRNSLYQDI